MLHYQPPIKPKRLYSGQTVGLIAPAGQGEDDEQIDAAIETIASLGFQVKPGRFLRARHAYFAGTDAERAADVNAMFVDREVAGIFALRGGYGCSRLLPLLDYEAIRQHPKLLCGYSDVTTILNAITCKAGLITFHGPIADQSYTPYTVAEFQKITLSPRSPVSLAQPPSFSPQPGRVQRQNRLTTLMTGKAQGRLVGGNLTLLSHLAGTPYMPDLAGAILFLEDVHEAVYRIDRMLTQLWLSGQLAQVAGIAFGKFTDCARSGGVSLASVLRERCQTLRIPAVCGLMIGHVADMATIPIGCRAELDADKGTLMLLEQAVL